LKKLLTLSLIIALAPLIGGIYGIVHDQITYSISPEYYTKFKFIQFGFVDFGTEAILPNPRLNVAGVGFLATWWMGLPIGTILGIVGLVHKNNNQMFTITMRAIMVAVMIAFLTGIIGLAYGKLYLAKAGVNWWLPGNLIDKRNFIAVGSMHNFSYIGGIAGLIAGCIYSIRQKRKIEKQFNTVKNAKK
jgi:hypothetical protein